MNISAGIVLFNPNVALLKKNVDALYTQVDKILLYNNGSQNFETVKNVFADYSNVIFKDGKENKGIAFALNKILDWADNEQYDWVLTMDQDSVCANNLIQEYSAHLNDKNIALLCPFILNNGKYTLNEYKKLKLTETTEIVDPVKCITSGCLTNVKIAKKVRGFNNALFIDCVDFDLNCKVLEAGYRILQVNSTYLIQKMGKGKKIRLFDKLQHLTGIRLFRRAKAIAVYPDNRLYYYARNTRYLRKTYRNHGKRTSFSFVFIYYIYFSIFYPLDRSRIKMWKAMIKGFRDYRKITNSK